MRKIAIYALALCLLLLAPQGAMGEDLIPATEDATLPAEDLIPLTLSGSVVAGETALVTAPYGGRVDTFRLRAGDLVTAGQTLFTIKPTEVLAPCEGTVVGIRPEAGDDAAFLQNRYGALLYLEPSNPFIIETNTKNAYNASDNRDIHIGEVVYIESRVYYNKSGVGYVTAVDADNYTVEVIGGNLVLYDDVTLYREPDFVNHSKIGTGTIDRNTLVPITSEGSVLAIHVAEGDHVERGDLLLEVVEGTLPQGTKPGREVKAGVDGIVASIDITAGAKATAQQVLATIYPSDQLQVAAEIHELDIANIQVGNQVRVGFPGVRTEEPIRGKVESISALNISSSGDAQYLVYVSFETTAQVRMGMSATIYVNE